MPLVRLCDYSIFRKRAINTTASADFHQKAQSPKLLSCFAWAHGCGATPVTDIIDNANVGRIHAVQRSVLAIVRDFPGLTVGMDAIYRTVCPAVSIVAAKDLALKHWTSGFTVALTRVHCAFWHCCNNRRLVARSDGETVPWLQAVGCHDWQLR